MIKPSRISSSFILLPLFTFFLFPVYAQIETLGYFKIDECIDLIQICSDCSYVNITSIYYPNSSRAIGEVAMTQSGTTFSYNFCNTSQFGQYLVNGIGDDGGYDEIFSYNFYVTPNGEPNQDSNFIIFVYVLFGGILFLLMFTFVMNVAKIATLSTTVYDVALSFGMYLIMLFTWWLANDYTTATLIRDNMGIFITVTAFSHVVLPFVSLAVTVFYKLTSKKKNLSVEELTGKMFFTRGSNK